MKNLKSGITSLNTIINENCFFSDKTEWIIQYINKGKFLYTSRPNGFGKSLFISIIENLYKNNKKLFQNTFAYHNFEFSKKEIIKLDIKKIYSKTCTLSNTLDNEFKEISLENDLKLPTSSSLKRKFYEIIENLYKKNNDKIVVLIDSADFPLMVSDKNSFKNIEAVLFDVITALESAEEYIHKCIITGYTDYFSKFGFITDLSFTKLSDQVFGFSKKEIENHFEEYLNRYQKYYNLNRNEIITKLEDIIGNFSFSGELKVFHPSSILGFMNSEKIEDKLLNSFSSAFLKRLLSYNTDSVSMEFITSMEEFLSDVTYTETDNDNNDSSIKPDNNPDEITEINKDNLKEERKDILTKDFAKRRISLVFLDFGCDLFDDESDIVMSSPQEFQIKFELDSFSEDNISFKSFLFRSGWLKITEPSKNILNYSFRGYFRNKKIEKEFLILYLSQIIGKNREETKLYIKNFAYLYQSGKFDLFQNSLSSLLDRISNTKREEEIIIITAYLLRYYKIPASLIIKKK